PVIENIRCASLTGVADNRLLRLHRIDTGAYLSLLTFESVSSGRAGTRRGWWRLQLLVEDGLEFGCHHESDGSGGGSEGTRAEYLGLGQGLHRGLNAVANNIDFRIGDLLRRRCHFSAADQHRQYVGTDGAGKQVELGFGVLLNIFQ